MYFVNSSIFPLHGIEEMTAFHDFRFGVLYLEHSAAGHPRGLQPLDPASFPSLLLPVLFLPKTKREKKLHIRVSRVLISS